MHTNRVLRIFRVNYRRLTAIIVVGDLFIGLLWKLNDIFLTFFRRERSAMVNFKVYGII